MRTPAVALVAAVLTAFASTSCRSTASTATEPATLVPQVGHSGGVEDVAFSPDGTWLATGGVDGRVCLWDPATGEEVASWQATAGSLWAVRFSPDGSVLAAAAQDWRGPGGVSLWRPPTGELLAELPVYGSPRAIAFSLDGRLLAVGTAYYTRARWSGHVHLFETATHREVWRTPEPIADVHGVAFSPDATCLAVSTTGGPGGVSDSERTGVIRIWRVGTAEEVRSLSRGRGSFSRVAYTPDGRHIVAAQSREGSAPQVVAWNAETGEEVREFEGPGGPPGDLLISADSQPVASGQGDATLRVLSPASGKSVTAYPGIHRLLYGAKFSPDGTMVARADTRAGLRVVDASSGKVIRDMRSLRGSAYVAFRPGTALLEVGDYRGGALVDTSATGSSAGLRALPRDQFQTLRPPDPASGFRPPSRWTRPLLATQSPDGRLNAVADGYGPIRLEDATTGDLLHVLEGHADELRILRFSPDSRWLASVDASSEFGLRAGGVVLLWDTRTGRRTRTFHCDGHYAHLLAFTDDSRHLVVGSERGAVLAFSVDTDEMVRYLPTGRHPVTALGMARRGRLLAAGVSDGAVYVWDLATGATVATLAGHEGPIVSLALREDGGCLAAGKSGGQVGVWDVGGQRLLATVALLPGRADLGATVPPTEYGVWTPGSAADWSAGAMDRLRVREPDGSLRRLRSADDPMRGPDAVAAALRGAAAPVLGPDEHWLPAAGDPRQIGHLGAATCLAVGPDGTSVASGGWEGSVILWSIEAAEDGSPKLRRVRVMNEHRNSVEAVAFSSDGARVASAGLDRKVVVWDVATGSPALILPVWHGRRWTVGFGAGDTVVFALGDGGRGIAWDTRTGAVVAEVDLGLEWPSAAVSPDGAFVVVSGMTRTPEDPEAPYRPQPPAEPRLVRLELPSLRVTPLGASRAGRASAVAVAPSGELALAWGATLRLVGPDARNELRSITEPLTFNGVDHVAVSRDGKRIAAADDAGALRVWDLETGRRLVWIESAGESTEALVFALGGRCVVSADRDGYLLVWDAATGELLAGARGRANPGDAVWAQYQLYVPFEVLGGGWIAMGRHPEYRGTMDHISQVYFVSPDEAVYVESLSRLRGRVRIRTPEEALAFASLPLEPGPEIPYGIYSESIEERCIGPLPPPDVEETPDGFTVWRQLRFYPEGRRGGSNVVMRQETVGRDGSYTRRDDGVLVPPRAP